MTDIINGLVAQAEGHIGAFRQRVGRKDVIVQLVDSSDNLDRGSDCVSQIVIFAVANGHPIQREFTKTRAGTFTSGAVDEQALQAGAVVRKRGVAQLAAIGSADIIDDSCRDLAAVPVVSDTANQAVTATITADTRQ